MYTFEVSEDLKGLTLSLPQYFAAMPFWNTEWCSVSNPAPRCVPYEGGYEKQVPLLIQGILAYGVPSRKLLLGLHADGIDINTIKFWCQQIIDNDLGGVMVSFINRMDTNLFYELQICLGENPPAPAPGPVPTPTPAGCNAYTVKLGEGCWGIAKNECGIGSNWSTVLYKDSSCTTPMDEAACALQPDQQIYSKCT
jgi:hypothetical protein